MKYVTITIYVLLLICPKIHPPASAFTVGRSRVINGGSGRSVEHMPRVYSALVKSAKKVGCWFVCGDDLTGALHILQLQLLPPLPSSIAPIKLACPGSPRIMLVNGDSLLHVVPLIVHY